MKRLRFLITKNKNKFGTKVHDTQNSTIATEAHQLYVAPNTTMLHKMVVRKTSETHKPTNKKDAFSRNNDTAKANYSFYTRTQHLTGAHYSRLQHSIDSCRTIMMSNLQKTCTNLLINAIHRDNLKHKAT